MSVGYLTLTCHRCDFQKEVTRVRGAQRFSCNCGDFVTIIDGDDDLRGGCTVTYKRLVTENIVPPIPVRQFDWRAHLDGEEGRSMGWGPSRHDAILDLLCEIESRMDARAVA
jgi:hypothetical protein